MAVHAKNDDGILADRWNLEVVPVPTGIDHTVVLDFDLAVAPELRLDDMSVDSGCNSCLSTSRSLPVDLADLCLILFVVLVVQPDFIVDTQHQKISASSLLFRCFETRLRMYSPNMLRSASFM